MTATIDTPTIPTMENPTTTVRVSENDELDVWVSGEGTPVILSHGAFWPDLLGPLGHELASSLGYQVIQYHRRGYNGTPTAPIDYSAHALDIVKILDALGVDEAHVFGHSYAANIVLDLAAEFPDRVLSVAEVEHVVGLPKEAIAGFFEAAGPVLKTYQNGDLSRAAVDFLALAGIAGDLVDQIPPECVDNFFQVDVPAMGTMQVNLAKLGENGTPVLAMRASDAAPIFVEACAGLRAAASQTREFVMPDSDHMFPVRQPAETAAVLDKWFRGLDD